MEQVTLLSQQRPEATCVQSELHKAMLLSTGLLIAGYLYALGDPLGAI
jgi:hypothetical protein